MMVGFERNYGRDQWTTISDEVIASLRVIQPAPLILQLDYPDVWERPSTVARAELVLAVGVQTYDAEGEAHIQRYHLRLDPRGEGIFPVVAFEPPRREAELWMIDPLTLEAFYE